MPSAEISSEVKTVIDALVAVGAAKSKGDARRLIEGGGVSVNEDKVTEINALLPEGQNEFILHKGKKLHIKVIVK